MTHSQEALAKAFELAWPLLYAFEPGAVRDSSKNLRVLWSRALLHSLGEIDDPVAYQLLPRATRALVGERAAASLWTQTGAGKTVVGKLEWVAQRTRFIDGQLEDWLKGTTDSKEGALPRERQVLLLGGGYDTRSLRYRRHSEGRRLRFYEVDLPDIAATKERMVARYLDASSAKGGEEGVAPGVIHIGVDMNELGEEGLLPRLGARGFRIDLPTLVVCEAVLFYLEPATVAALTSELFAAFPNLNGPKVHRWVFTDNLSKVGVTPGPPVPLSAKDKCGAWLERNSRSLLAHDAIWGGAIHFAAAE